MKIPKGEYGTYTLKELNAYLCGLQWIKECVEDEVSKVIHHIELRNKGRDRKLNIKHS